MRTLSAAKTMHPLEVARRERDDRLLVHDLGTRIRGQAPHPPGHLPKLLRQREDHVLLATLELLGDLPAPGLELADDALHEHLRCGGAGGDADGLRPVEPFAVQLLRAIDEVARD